MYDPVLGRCLLAREEERGECVCSLAMKEKEVEGSPVLRGIVDLRIVDLDPKNPSSYLPSRLVHFLKKPPGLKT